MWYEVPQLLRLVFMGDHPLGWWLLGLQLLQQKIWGQRALRIRQWLLHLFFLLHFMKLLLDVPR